MLRQEKKKTGIELLLYEMCFVMTQGTLIYVSAAAATAAVKSLQSCPTL